MKKAENASVKIIPLGGLEQIGMNITAIEYDDSIVVRSEEHTSELQSQR